MPVLIDFIATLPAKIRSTPDYHHFYAVMHDEIIEYVRKKTKSAIKDGMAMHMDLAQICISIQNLLHQQFSNVSCLYLGKAVANTAYAAKFSRVRESIVAEFNQLTSPIVMEVISAYYHEQLEASKKKSSISLGAEQSASVHFTGDASLAGFLSAQKSIGMMLAKTQAYKPSPIPFKATTFLKKEASTSQRFLKMLEQYPPIKMEKSFVEGEHRVEVSLIDSRTSHSKDSSSEHSFFSSSSARSPDSAASGYILDKMQEHQRAHSYDREMKVRVEARHQKGASLNFLSSSAAAADSNKDDVWIGLVMQVKSASRFFKKRALNNLSQAVTRFLSESESIIKSAEELLSPMLKQLDNIGKDLCANFPQHAAGVHSFFTKNELLLGEIEQVGKHRNIVIRKAIKDAESISSIFLEINVGEEREKLDTAAKKWKELLKNIPYLFFNSKLVALKNELKASLALMPHALPCKEKDQLNQLELFIIKMGEMCQRIQSADPDLGFFKMEISEIQDRNINREHCKGSKFLRDEIALIEAQIQALKKQWIITIASSSFFGLQEAFIDWVVVGNLSTIQKTSDLVSFEKYLEKRPPSSRVQYDELEYIRYWQWNCYLEWKDTSKLDKRWDDQLKAFSELDPEACHKYQVSLNSAAKAPQAVKYTEEFHRVDDRQVIKEFALFRDTFFKRDGVKLEQLGVKSDQLQRKLEKTKISDPEAPLLLLR